MPGHTRVEMVDPFSLRLSNPDYSGQVTEYQVTSTKNITPITHFDRVFQYGQKINNKVFQKFRKYFNQF